MRTEDLQEHRAPRAPTPNAVSDWGETELNNSPIGLFSNTSLPIDALSGVSPFLLRTYSSRIIILDPHFIAVALAWLTVNVPVQPEGAGKEKQ